MAVVLAFNSALEFYRSRPPQLWMPERTSTSLRMVDLEASAGDLRRAALSEVGVRHAPVHYLCRKGRRKAIPGETVPHTFALDELPAGSLLQLTPKIYVTSPELTYIQMAGAVSPLGAVTLGYELCGRYSHFAPLVSGFYDRQPLTTKAAIAQAIDLMPGIRGAKAARTALRWVCERSRSPMETVVACALFLPGGMGGWSLKMPALNHRVRLDESSARIAGTKSCLIDVAWPSLHIGLEYDSDAFHTDPDKDRRRREALTHMGWQIFVIELDEIRNYTQLENKVALFAGRVPLQSRTTPATPAERRKLLSSLLNITRFGLGMDAALFGTQLPKGKVSLHL